MLPSLEPLYIAVDEREDPEPVELDLPDLPDVRVSVQPLGSAHEVEALEGTLELVNRERLQLTELAELPELDRGTFHTHTGVCGPPNGRRYPTWMRRTRQGGRTRAR